MKLSILLKQIRQDKKMTLEQFGKECGLSRSYLSKIEKGEMDDLSTSVDTILKISKTSNIPATTIIYLISN